MLGHHLDDVVGAHGGAGTAAGALLPVHLGDAVLNVDGVEGAGPGAVPVAQAAVGAGPVAAVQALDGLAAGDTLEGVALGGLLTGAGAGHNGLHRHHASRFHTHDLSDGRGGFRAAGDALVDAVPLFHDALGVVGAARAAAGAAVGPGQHAGDLLHPLIHRDVHDDGGNHQNDRTDQADHRNQHHRHQNHLHIHTLSPPPIRRRRCSRRYRRSP